MTAIDVRIPLAAISADIGLPNAQPEMYQKKFGKTLKIWKNIFFLPADCATIAPMHPSKKVHGENSNAAMMWEMTANIDFPGLHSYNEHQPRKVWLITYEAYKY